MIATTTPDAALWIARNLGPDEICLKLYGRDEASRLAYHVATTSPLSWTAYAPDGEPVAMFGCFPDDAEPFAHAWMFSTANAKRAAKTIVKEGRRAMELGRKHWRELRVDAEARSGRQDRFLEFMGYRPRTVEIVSGETRVELAA